MKTTKGLIFLVIFFLSISARSQNALYETNSIIAVQGYGLKLLNAKGNSGISNHISNLSYLNPAALNEFENYELGISYQLSSKIDEAHFGRIGTERINDFFPQSAGGILKFNGFSLGIGLGQRYNSKLDFGPVPITTPQDPNGTGEFFHLEYETSVRNYSAALSYSFKELFNWDNDLIFGIRYNHNKLHYFEDSPFYSINENVTADNWAIGTIYNINYTDKKSFKIGLSYESIAEFEKTFGTSYTLVIRDSIIQPVLFYSKLIDKIPAELKLDLYTDLLEDFEFMMSFTNVYWNKVSSNYKNQFEFSGSAVYQLNEMFQPSLGFYYSGRDFVEDFFETNSKLQVFFVTGGVNYNCSLINVNLSIANSSLFSGDYRIQTIVKLAIGVNL